MKPISIETYIASNNPNEAMSLLKEMGSPKPVNFDDFVAKLHIATQRYGAKAFERLSKIDTPYQKLILSGSETKSNCGGCSGVNGIGSEDLDAQLAAIPASPNGEPIVTQVKVAEPVAPIIIAPSIKPSYFELHPAVKYVGGTLLVLGVIYAVGKITK